MQLEIRITDLDLVSPHHRIRLILLLFNICLQVLTIKDKQLSYAHRVFSSEEMKKKIYARV